MLYKTASAEAMKSCDELSETLEDICELIADTKSLQAKQLKLAATLMTSPNQWYIQ